ncbi:MAG: hypothetical protein LBB29_01325, partial [Holosporaceae bacterium]|nr:hypothetical protein [Holosporaceae bacterium]
MTKKSIFLLCLAQLCLLTSAEAVEKKIELISVPNEYEVGNGFVGMQRDVVRLLERKILEIAPDDTV